MDLLEGEFRIDVQGGDDLFITSREWASDKIKGVAESCAYGGFPGNISAFDLGRALGRALSNCNEEDPHAELQRGLERYLSLKAKA